jgi:transcriptional regulator with XRE-family HTH domain
VTLLEHRLGHALRYLRLRAQLTQQAVCDVVRTSGGEISVIYLSMLERGQRNPSPVMLDRLLAALQSDRDELTRLCEQQPWATVPAARISSTPRMRPQAAPSSAATWSDSVVARPERAVNDDSFDTLAELWPRIPKIRKRELVQRARRYAEQ